MNKFKTLLIAGGMLFIGSTAMAQKTGYISLDQVVAIMPEVAKIDTQMQKFQADSINAEFEALVRDYKYYDSIMNSADTSRMTKNVKGENSQKLQTYAYQIQNWQQISQNIYQQKQQQLLEPVYRKVMTAIQTIAKEKGYTYIYDKSVLIIGPQGDDLLPAVAQRLKVTVPPNTLIGLR